MITVSDLEKSNSIPAALYDGNGHVVDRKITAFDPATGDVDSFELDANGRFVIDGDCLRIKREQFTPPLTIEVT